MEIDNKRKKIIIITVITVFIVILYISSYFLSTSIYYGKDSEYKYDVRIFKSHFHRSIFSPIFSIEKGLKNDEESKHVFMSYDGTTTALPPKRDVLNE